MKKIFNLLLLLILSIITISNIWAGGSGENSNMEKVRILFWPGGPESDALQNIVDNYNKTQGVTDNVNVETLYFSRQGFFEKLKADLAAGSDEFDINLVTTYSLGNFAPYLEPIDSYYDKDKSIYIASSLNSLAYEGKQYGVPSDVGIHFLYYRKDFIDKLISNSTWTKKYGEISKKYIGKELKPKQPNDWTWDDYIATSLFFTKSINPDSPTEYGTVLQLKNLLFNIMIWQSTMVSNGGNWLDDKGNVIINSPEAKKGLEIYQKIIDNHATPKSSLNYEFAESNEAFKSEQVATMMQWSAAYSILANKEESPKVYDKVSIASLPAGTKGHMTHVHSLGFGINKNSTHKAAAAKFLNYFASEEALKIYVKGGTPPVESILQGSADINASLPIVASSLSNAYVIKGGTASYALPVYTLQAEEFSAVWSGNQTIDQALANTEKRMKDLINK